ncbi:hypothetical protein D3C73_1360730 [compost metagenome]
MQADMQFLHARVTADLGRQRIAVHLWHLDVRNHHQELFFRPLALVHQLAQVVQSLAPIIERHHLDTDRLQAAADLLARHRRIIDGQHTQQYGLVLRLGIDHTG